MFWLLRELQTDFFEGNIFNHKNRSPTASFHGIYRWWRHCFYLYMLSDVADIVIRNKNDFLKIWQIDCDPYGWDCISIFQLMPMAITESLTFRSLGRLHLTWSWRKDLRVLLFEASHFLPDSFELQSGVQIVVSCILNTQHPQRYNYYLLSVGAILNRQLWDKPLRNPIEGYYTFLNQFCVRARVCGREQLNDSFLSAFPFFSAFIIQSYHPGPLNHKQNPCPKSWCLTFVELRGRYQIFVFLVLEVKKKLMSQQLLKAVGVYQAHN